MKIPWVARLIQIGLYKILSIKNTKHVGGYCLVSRDEPLKLEEKRKFRTSKFLRIPLIIHTTLKRDNTLMLQIEHLQVRRTAINIPKDILEINPEDIGGFIKEIYPNAKSFIIQYESKDGCNIPFCAQLFLSGRSRRYDSRRDTF